jgi:hypothetical protein
MGRQLRLSKGRKKEAEEELRYLKEAKSPSLLDTPIRVNVDVGGWCDKLQGELHRGLCKGWKGQGKVR